MAKPVVAWCISEWGKTSQTSTIHNMKRNGFLRKPNLSSICFNLNFLLLCWLFSLTTGLEGPSVQNQRRKQEGWRSPVESRLAGRRAQGPGAQCPCSQPELGLRPGGLPPCFQWRLDNVQASLRFPQASHSPSSGKLPAAS